MCEANLREMQHEAFADRELLSPQETHWWGRRGPVHTLGQHLNTFSSLKCLQRASSSISAGQRRAALQRVLFPSHQTQVTFWPWAASWSCLQGVPGPPPVPNPPSPAPACLSPVAWLRGSRAHSVCHRRPGDLMAVAEQQGPTGVLVGASLPRGSELGLKCRILEKPGWRSGLCLCPCSVRRGPAGTSRLRVHF